MSNTPFSESTWLADHPREKDNHRGRCIAVVGDEIVASATDLAQVLARAGPFQKGSRRLLVSRVMTKVRAPEIPIGNPHPERIVFLGLDYLGWHGLSWRTLRKPLPDRVVSRHGTECVPRSVRGMSGALKVVLNPWKARAFLVTKSWTFTRCSFRSPDIPPVDPHQIEIDLLDGELFGLARKYALKRMANMMNTGLAAVRWSIVCHEKYGVCQEI